MAVKLGEAHQSADGRRAALFLEAVGIMRDQTKICLACPNKAFGGARLRAEC